MIIGISECDERGTYEESVIESYRKIPGKGYGVFWKDFAVVFSPNRPIDRERFREYFIQEETKAFEQPLLSVQVTKGDDTLIEGMYEVREFFTRIGGAKTLEIHVATRQHLGEFRVYITPESHETFEGIFEQIFS